MNAAHPGERLAAIGLGSSLGNRRATLERALVQLDVTAGLRLVRASRWYRTPPLKGGSARGWFLNGVALFSCELSPHALLQACRDLEDRAGRRRGGYWGDRTLDLDVLILEDLVVSDARLTVPHPSLHLRPFVLRPLLEVWPDAIDAATGRPVRDHPAPPGPGAVPVGVVARSGRSVTRPR